MAEFLKAAMAADIPDPGKLLLEVDDRLVVVADLDDAGGNGQTHGGGSSSVSRDQCTWASAATAWP